MRPTLVLATAAVLVVGVLGTPAAGSGTTLRAATTVLGQAGPGVAVCNATAPAAVVLASEAAAGPSYVAPANGVITGFAHQANGAAGQVQALVLADLPSSANRRVVAKSAKMTVVVNQVNTFATHVRIKKGQRLGLWYSTNLMACLTVGTTGDSSVASAPFDSDTNATFAPTGVFVGSYRPNIAATFAPEPDTRITKKPRDASTRDKVKVKIKFKSSIAGSTFQCKLDGHKKWKKCKSPFKRRLGVGKHELRVRAVSPAGIPDPKPAKARFKIRRA